MPAPARKSPELDGQQAGKCPTWLPTEEWEEELLRGAYLSEPTPYSLCFSQLHLVPITLPAHGWEGGQAGL